MESQYLTSKKLVGRGVQIGLWEPVKDTFDLIQFSWVCESIVDIAEFKILFCEELHWFDVTFRVFESPFGGLNFHALKWVTGEPLGEPHLGCKKVGYKFLESSRIRWREVVTFLVHAQLCILEHMFILKVNLTGRAAKHQAPILETFWIWNFDNWSIWKSPKFISPQLIVNSVW